MELVLHPLRMIGLCPKKVTDLSNSGVIQSLQKILPTPS